jgi:hypothetical protein
MKPQEGFETWSSFFLGSLHPDQDYEQFFPACTSLIIDLVDHGELSPPLTSYTTHFLRKFLPHVITSIHALQKVRWASVTATGQFLKICTSLLPGIFASGLAGLFPVFLQIFSKDTPLYKTTKDYAAAHRGLIEAFVAHEILSILLLEMGSRPQTPADFLFVATILDGVILKTDTRVAQSQARALFMAFDALNFSGQMADLVAVIPRLIAIRKIASDIHFGTGLFCKILTLADGLFRDEDFEKQLIGAQIFNCFTGTGVHDSITALFEEFSRENNLERKLMDPNGDPRLFVALRSLVINLVKTGRLAPNILIALWASNSAHKADILDLSREIFTVLKDDDFVTVASQLASLNDPDFVAFLVDLIKAKTREGEILAKLVEILVQQEFSQQDCELIKALYTPTSNSDFRKCSLQLCRNVLRDKFSLSCLKVLVFLTSASSNVRADLDSGFIQRLQILWIKSKNPAFFELFEILVKKRAMVVYPEFAESLWANKNWTFLQSVLVGQGQIGFSQTCFQSVRDLILNMDCPGAEYLAFLVDFIKVFNTLSGKTYSRAKSDSVEYLVRAVPLELEHKLFEVVDKEIAQKAILWIYTKCEKVETAAYNLLDRFRQAHTEAEKAVLLNLLYEFCVKLEEKILLRDVPIERHSQRIDMSGSTRVFIKFPDQTQIEMTVTSAIKANALLLGLGPYLEMAPTEYHLTTGSRSIPGNSTLSACNVWSRSVIQIVDGAASSIIMSHPIPSKLFAERGLVGELLKMLGEDHSPELWNCCQRMLSFLPNDPSLMKLSVEPAAFFEKLRGISGPLELAYALEILLWRLTSPRYLDKYNKYELNKHLISLLERTKQVIGSVVALLRKLTEPAPPEVVLALLLAFLDSDVSIDSKVDLAKYLREKVDLSKFFADEVGLMEKVILSLVPPIWDEFAELFNLFSSATAVLSQKLCIDEICSDIPSVFLLCWSGMSRPGIGPGNQR